MQDICSIDAYSVSYDSFGDAVETWIPSSGIACGLEMAGGKETYKGQLIVLNIDAIIRLPLDTTVNVKDRITISQRFGVAISGLQFEVVDFPKRGPSGLVVGLKRIET